MEAIEKHDDLPNLILPIAHKGGEGMHVEHKEFTSSMAMMASSVCIASAQDGEIRFGRTITSLMSLSATPPSLAIAITKTSELAQLILRTKKFAVSMLAEDQQQVADVFAGKGRELDRFAFGKWEQGLTGQPKLLGAMVNMSCELIGTVEIDSHVICAGMILSTEITEELQPLMWHKRDYHTLA